MRYCFALLLAVFPPALTHTPLALKPAVQYTLRVDSADLSGWNVEIRLQNPTGTVRLAMAAHPEYDDRYWRYVTNFAAQPASGTATVTKADSAVWQIVAPRGALVVRYRIALPPAPEGRRGAWRPYLTSSGGLVGGPHAFMYVLGGEQLPIAVTLDLPRGWDVATGLERRGQFLVAAKAETLIDSPIFVGRFYDWRFVESGIPHRVIYWPLPNATRFDTSAFRTGVQAVVRQAIALFGRAPYRDYTFIFQDGAYGGLEHENSVTLGAASADLAGDPNANLRETAHEFVHTWNLMTIRPAEYRGLDYRSQGPVSTLWFSEGLTIFYAARLVRGATTQPADSANAHLERLLASYAGNPAYARFSAEQVSRVAYNADPGALGDYGASTHQQGEVIGTMLDFIIRDATRGRRSMDDVMRLLFERSAQPIMGRDIEQAVETVCACDVTPFFDAHVRGGAPIDYNRYLALASLQARVTWAPAVRNGEPERDLRIWGWEPEGQRGVRLVISNPTSIWARAGLHSRDQLLRVNGVAIATWPELRAQLQRLRMGDTVTVEVQRDSGPYTATVVVAGFDRASVRITPIGVP